jgi:hypothetical protein
MALPGSSIGASVFAWRPTGIAAARLARVAVYVSGKFAVFLAGTGAERVALGATVDLDPGCGDTLAIARKLPIYKSSEHETGSQFDRNTQ